MLTPPIHQNYPQNHESIVVKVLDDYDYEIHFRVNTMIPVFKVMMAYAKRKASPLECLQFIFAGKRVSGDETLKELGLEDQDWIEVYHTHEECGGCNAAPISLQKTMVVP